MSSNHYSEGYDYENEPNREGGAAKSDGGVDLDLDYNGDPGGLIIVILMFLGASAGIGYQRHKARQRVTAQRLDAIDFDEERRESAIQKSKVQATNLEDLISERSDSSSERVQVLETQKSESESDDKDEEKVIA